MSLTRNEEIRAASLPDDAVRSSLERALSSPEFRTSKRCQDFLRFVVERALAGRSDELKERLIGIEAFGRAVSYDSNEDGIVRIKASEVRRRLNAYYAGIGKQDPVKIELPVGGYIPHFVANATELRPLADEVPPSRQPPRKVTAAELRRRYAAPLVLLLAITAVFVVLRIRQRANIVEQFWQPVLKGSERVLIAAAYVPAYTLERPGVPVESTLPPHRPGDPPDEYVKLEDQYAGGGDLLATARIVGLLSSLHHPYQTKLGVASFDDLRSAPSVLIGASSDQWATVSSRLRFYIDTEHGRILDHGQPTPWALHNLNRQFHTDEDYALVSRLFDEQTHAMLVLATGITQYGTEAAAEVVTDPALLAEALQHAPVGWQHKNLQLVLHMSVISNYPASPSVIASYFW